MRQPDERLIASRHRQDIAHGVELELVKVDVDGGAEERLELVRAGLDLILGGLGRIRGRNRRRIFRLLFLLRWLFRGLEAQCRGWRVQEALLDTVEGAFGEDVDAVDDVVDEALRMIRVGWLLV